MDRHGNAGTADPLISTVTMLAITALGRRAGCGLAQCVCVCVCVWVCVWL